MVIGLLIASGAVAGLFGALLGLGGGILVVPILTIGFGLDLRAAVGVSLIAVIVTSSASSGPYLQRHLANLRLGMSLELFTAAGALVGGLLAFALDERVLAGLFAALLVYVAISMARTPQGEGSALLAEGRPATLRSRQPDEEPAPGYVIRNWPLGVVGSAFAGLVSALLGVGGGIVKVPLLNLAMGVPLRVATATSNLMIGVTAAASATIYLLRGGIDPYVAGPMAIGVFVGASVGARVGDRIDARILRILFVVVLLGTAFEMALKVLQA